jgi:transcriptional regulator with XRE-family HTH domain
MNKVKYFRESKNITQSELAEQSRLSLRTIQRIESGIEPKGHTLKMLTKVFDVECFELFEIPESCSNETDVIKSIKTLNTSILTFLIIPYGNIVFPPALRSVHKKNVIALRWSSSSMVSDLEAINLLLKQCF